MNIMVLFKNCAAFKKMEKGKGRVELGAKKCS